MGKKAAPLDEKGKMKSCRRVEKTRMENSTARHLKKIRLIPIPALALYLVSIFGAPQVEESSFHIHIDTQIQMCLRIYSIV